jgi:hypothetical protein
MNPLIQKTRNEFDPSCRIDISDYLFALCSEFPDSGCSVSELKDINGSQPASDTPTVRLFRRTSPSDQCHEIHDNISGYSLYSVITPAPNDQYVLYLRDSTRWLSIEDDAIHDVPTYAVNFPVSVLGYVRDTTGSRIEDYVESVRQEARVAAPHPAFPAQLETPPESIPVFPLRVRWGKKLFKLKEHKITISATTTAVDVIRRVVGEQAEGTEVNNYILFWMSNNWTFGMKRGTDRVFDREQPDFDKRTFYVRLVKKKDYLVFVAVVESDGDLPYEVFLVDAPSTHINLEVNSDTTTFRERARARIGEKLGNGPFYAYWKVDGQPPKRDSNGTTDLKLVTHVTVVTPKPNKK